MKLPQIVYLEPAHNLVREMNLIKNYCREIGVPTDTINRKYVERRTIELNPDCVVEGTIMCCHAVLDYFKRPIPFVDTYPPELRRFLCRNITATTLGALGEGFYGFVKPANAVKKWTGFVVNDPSDMYQLAAHSRHTEVYTSEIVKFVSEWRFYIIGRTIRARGNYEGDESTLCNEAVVQEAVDALQSPPAAFCIDFGVLEDGQTALVEYNDAYAVGWYPEEQADVFFELITVRFQELLASVR